MNRRKDIYCEKEFWGTLSNELSARILSPDPNTIHQEQNLIDWYGLLRRSNVFFDCSYEEIVNTARKDMYLAELIKNSGAAYGEIASSPGAIASMCNGPAQMNTQMYSSLFLSKETHTNQSRKVGVINIGSNEIHQTTHLFNDCGPSICRDSSQDWFQILKSAHADQNCNSMIIADKYIFKDVNANLYKILDILLPQKLGTTFYLSIFSLDGCTDSKVEEFRLQLDKKIHEVRPELSYSLEVFGCSTDDFHDRGIITNYLWIEIGAGFNLIKKGRARITTNIHVTYPMIISQERVKSSCDGYWNIIEDAKRCLRTRHKSSNNRLLR